MLVLGLETSCDETAAAVLRGREVLANIVSSQAFHERYGGVVPELASRAHLEAAVPVVRMALERAGVSLREIEGIAVTAGPGLVGSLLVGVSLAKAMAAALGVPLIGVDHLAAHAESIHLEWRDVPYPVVCLIASGGHTCLVALHADGGDELLGDTMDDAAGEVLDKVARLLGLPYPGGAALEALARGGRADAFAFTRPHMEGLDFSFSGLKTAVKYAVEDLAGRGADASGLEDAVRADIAASCQEAVVDVLASKARRASIAAGARGLALAGGVGANRRLRAGMQSVADSLGIPFHVPSAVFCTDNGAMIAARGARDLARGLRSGHDLNAYPTRRAFLHR